MRLAWLIILLAAIFAGPISSLAGGPSPLTRDSACCETEGGMAPHSDGVCGHASACCANAETPLLHDLCLPPTEALAVCLPEATGGRSISTSAEPPPPRA